MRLVLSAAVLGGVLVTAACAPAAAKDCTQEQDAVSTAETAKAQADDAAKAVAAAKQKVDACKA